MRNFFSFDNRIIKWGKFISMNKVDKPKKIYEMSHSPIIKSINFN